MRSQPSEVVVNFITKRHLPECFTYTICTELLTIQLGYEWQKTPKNSCLTRQTNWRSKQSAPRSHRGPVPVVQHGSINIVNTGMQEGVMKKREEKACGKVFMSYISGGKKACHATQDHRGSTRFGSDGRRGKLRPAPLLCFPWKKAKQGSVHCLGSASLNNCGRLWATGVVFRCLVPGSGMIWGTGNIDFVCTT